MVSVISYNEIWQSATKDTNKNEFGLQNLVTSILSKQNEERQDGSDLWASRDKNSRVLPPVNIAAASHLNYHRNAVQQDEDLAFSPTLSIDCQSPMPMDCGASSTSGSSDRFLYDEFLNSTTSPPRLQTSSMEMQIRRKISELSMGSDSQSRYNQQRVNHAVGAQSPTSYYSDAQTAWSASPQEQNKWFMDAADHHQSPSKSNWNNNSYQTSETTSGVPQYQTTHKCNPAAANASQMQYHHQYAQQLHQEQQQRQNAAFLLHAKLMQQNQDELARKQQQQQSCFSLPSAIPLSLSAQQHNSRARVASHHQPQRPADSYLNPHFSGLTARQFSSGSDVMVATPNGGRNNTSMESSMSLGGGRNVISIKQPNPTFTGIVRPDPVKLHGNFEAAQQMTASSDSGSRNTFQQSAEKTLDRALDKCFYQLHCLRKERTDAEADLTTTFPGKRVSSPCTSTMPESPKNSPSKVGKLIADQQFEHAKVKSLMESMEQVVEGPIDSRISGVLEAQYQCIHDVVTASESSVTSLTGRVNRLTTATKKTRSGVWSAMQFTLKEAV